MGISHSTKGGLEGGTPGYLARGFSRTAREIECYFIVNIRGFWLAGCGWILGTGEAGMFGGEWNIFYKKYGALTD